MHWERFDSHPPSLPKELLKGTMQRNLPLDGLRGVSVLMVLLLHHNCLNIGWMGVDVFFALSGFLITSNTQTYAGRRTLPGASSGSNAGRASCLHSC
jgi:hypothetical protein